MAQTRYYKAHIDHLTVFRSTQSRHYASVSVDSRYGGVSFSVKPPRGPGTAPTVEITAQEFRALADERDARIKAAGHSTATVAPQDSWVQGYV